MRKYGALELQCRWLGHFNVKRVHRIQSMVNDMNLSKILCPKSNVRGELVFSVMVAGWFFEKSS